MPTRALDARQSARVSRKAGVRRAVVVPAITYSPDLPVSARREDISATIRDHQVVIVSGETGSGKTTQLPKLLLELGRGRARQIGPTQPRRIAARTVAERIAEEIGTPLVEIVGYQVRFTDTSSDGTLVRVTTDGILLAPPRRSTPRGSLARPRVGRPRFVGQPSTEDQPVRARRSNRAAVAHPEDGADRAGRRSGSSKG